MSNKAAALLMTFLVATAAHALDKVPLRVPADNEPGVVIKDLKLEFDTVEAAAYTVQISRRRDFSRPLPLEKAVLVPKDDPLTLIYTVSVAKPEKLEPSTTYYWRVIANCTEPPAAGCIPSVSDVRSFTTEHSTQIFTSRGFSLTRALEGDKAKKGAAFKFAYSRASDEVYSAEYALQWRPVKGSLTDRTGHFLYFSFFNESVLSSDDEADTAVRFGAQLRHDWTTSATSSLHSNLALLHEADQSYDTRKNLIELAVNPTWKAAYIGYGTGNPTTSHVQFYWEPTAIVTVGRTLEIADSAETNDDVQRYALRLAGTAQLRFLERVLNFGSVSLTAASTGWYLPNEELERHHLFEGGIEFAVATDVSVGFEYKRGKEPPKFKGAEEYGLTVGIKF